MPSITVTTNYDGATDGSQITLIGAILTADNTDGGNTIILPADTTFTLSQAGYTAPLSGNGSVNTGITLLPGINQPIIIEGNGSSLTLSSGAAGRFFSITSSLTLDNINLIGGVAQGGAGGNGYADGGGGAGLGGAIFVDGSGASLTLTQASIAESSAIGGAGGTDQGGEDAGPTVGGGGGGGLSGSGGDYDGSTGGSGGGPAGGSGGGTASPGTAGGFGGGGGGGGGAVYTEGSGEYLNGGIGGAGGFGGGGGGAAYSPDLTNPHGGAGGFGGGGGAAGYGPSPGAAGAFGGSAGDGEDSDYQDGGGGAGLGGAIFDYQGTVSLNNASLVGNSATGGSGYGGGSGAGGAVFNYSGTVTLTDTTLADNSATASSGDYGGPDGSAQGAGLYNYKATGLAAPTVSLFDSALASNSVITQGDSGPNAPVEGDIFSGSGGTVTAHGTNHNFIGASSGAISGATVLSGAADLAFTGLYNGYVMAPPTSGSPLIGAADPSTSLSTDETGTERSNTAPTIGACEQTLPSPFPLSGGSILVTDDTLGAVFAIDPTTGNRETVSAANVVGAGPALINPTAIALDGNGNAYVVTADTAGDSDNEIVKIDLTTGNRTLLSGGSTGTGTAFQSISDLAYDSASSSLLVTDGNALAIYSVSTSTGNRTLLSNNTTPNGNNPFNDPTSITYNSTAGIVEGDQYFEPVTYDSALLTIASNGARTVFSGDTVPNTANQIGSVAGIANNLDGSILLIDDYSDPSDGPNPPVLDDVATTGTPGARTLVATLPTTASSGDSVSDYGVAASSTGIYVTQAGSLDSGIQVAADNQVLLVSDGTTTELAGNNLGSGPFWGTGLNIGIAVLPEVPAAPTVTTNPANATINSGGNTTFMSAATGNPAPTEQWQISTNGGATFTNLTNTGVYSGATTTSLSITGGTAALNGDEYRDVFTNTQGSAATTAATLTVDFAPAIATNPTSQTVNAAGNTSFTAAATGLPVPTVQWQVSTNGGSTFSNITNGGIYSGATTNTLSITDAPASMNTDQYRAVYSNTLYGAGSPSTATTNAATLTVNFAPVVTGNPSNATINAGSNTSFTSSAAGNPTPTEQWQVSTDGGATFTNITNGGVYSNATTATLTISAGTIAMNGYEYQDVFTNGSGTATTYPSTLTVIVPAAVQFSVGSETVNEAAGTFTIPVSISGTPTPVVSTFASGLDGPGGAAVDAEGNLYVANQFNYTVSKVTPAGVVSTFASNFSDPQGLAFDATGNLYVANLFNNTVSKVTPTGAVSTFATGLNTPYLMAFEDGNLYVSNYIANTVSEVTPAGVVSTFASGFSGPSGLAFDADGNLYVANEGAGTLSKVTPAGVVSTFASGFSDPIGLAFDAAGNLFVANDGNDTVSGVTPAGAVSTIASGFSGPQGLAYRGGNLYVTNFNENTVSQISLDTTAIVPFTLSGTAVSGTDYSGVTVSPLTFAPGQTTQNITGTLLSDPGPSQTLVITLGTPTGAALGSPDVNTLTIINTITLTVTNMTDAHVDDELSLREALAIVSGANGNYIINVPAGTIDLSQGILSTDDPGYSVAINGVGPGPTVVDAQESSVVMQVTPDTTSDISNFEFTGGYDPGNNGYGGGGVENAGTLTLNSCTVDSNSDTEGGHGGGIGNLGTLTVEDSTVTGNSTDGAAGGIYNDGGALTVINSTIAMNSAGGTYNGGGIVNVGGTCTITDATIDDNEGGGVFNLSGALLLQGSIVGDSTNGPDLYGPTSGTDDLIGDGSGSDSGLTAPLSGEPMLAPLGSYGGTTQTMAPLPGSPAIASGGTFADAAGLDQRGIERSLEAPTIGAFESQGFVVTTTDKSGMQSVLVGTPFDDLQVQVTSNDPGVPLTGGIITFTAPQSGASAILGADTATLDVNGDAEVSASANTTPGTYSVIASAGSAPSTNGVFSLTNTPAIAPMVTTNPTNDTINAGSNASFTAAATGNLPPTQQWQVSTDGGDTFTDITNDGVYTGATTGTLTITGGTAAMNGDEYRDVFTNGSGTATTDASTLTVDFAPTVTTNPVNETISSGSNASFTVAATGNPTPTVQWQVSYDGGATFTNLSNDDLYGGVTTDTLTLTDATLAQNGYEYQAVFSNTLYGTDSPSTATTAAATLTVNAAPVVTGNPNDVTINAGGDTSFTTSATGYPIPTEHWQVSTNGGITFTNITNGGVYSGANTTTLTITTGTAAMNGDEYRDVFTNGSGTATTDASTLTVDFAPTVTTNPVNETISSGSNASFTVAATGNPTPAVQWQVSYDGGATFTNLTNNGIYSGVTTDTLTLTGATLTQNGDEYQAIFSNTLYGTDSPSTATTTAATLTVNAAPVVTINPSNATINAGSSTNFVSAATGGPTPTEHWQVSTNGGITFTNITNGGVYSGVTTATLTITDGTAAMNGYEYRDVFTNGSGTATTDASTLTVDFAPTITTNPSSQTIDAGDNATFTATATGNPKPSVQWQISTNGGATFTNLSNVGPYSGVNTDTLTVSDASEKQNGTEYQAVFSNTLYEAASASTATSLAATLTVNADPIIGPITVSAWTKGGSNFGGVMLIEGGSPLYTIVSKANVPAGLTPSIVSREGVYMIAFAGTPTVAGTFNGSIEIQDNTGAETSQTFSILINPSLRFSAATLPAYTVGAAYTDTIKTAGGTGARVVTYSFSGSLPAGMTITSSGTSNSITIKGTPRTATALTITMTVTDSVGATTIEVFNLTGQQSNRRRGQN